MYISLRFVSHKAAALKVIARYRQSLNSARKHTCCGAILTVVLDMYTMVGTEER